MLIIECAICHASLEQPGGLYFTPPDKDGNVHKIHVCALHSIDVKEYIKLSGLGSSTPSADDHANHLGYVASCKLCTAYRALNSQRSAMTPTSVRRVARKAKR